ncbi:MAG: LON peptidase substrate-binding domain-containing protein [Acidobacteria bacterium]|nr:LON peptidase substrate-binding domain-containing protein [Acidobacteriota bacterium]
MTETPMFPLGTVLFPYAGLPLRAFEPRYLELVRHCLDTTPEFGVALIERGREVGGGDQRFDIGCIARIVETAEDPRGFWHLVTVGTRRIRIERWLDDAPYPRAEIEEWPDGPASPDAAARVGTVVPQLRRVQAMAAELGVSVASVDVTVDDDPTVASYQLAAMAPLGMLDRLTLLGAVTPDARLIRLGELLTETEALLASRLGGG